MTKQFIAQVQVGAGTKSGSYQVQPLTDIHGPIGFTLIPGNLSHGSEVHVTVIAANNAGLRSVFQSLSPLIIDHTPPIIVNLAVAVDVRKSNESGIVDEREDITATWDVMEETSDISYCTCALGNVDYHIDISSYDPIKIILKMAKEMCCVCCFMYRVMIFRPVVLLR